MPPLTNKSCFIPLCLSLLASSPTTLASNRDLSLALAASPATAAAGETVTYTLTVTNNGSKPAKKVIAATPLPADTELVSVPSNCRAVQTDHRLICKAKRLAPGQSLSWTFVAQIGASGTQPTTATVKSNKRDANPTDNRAELAREDRGSDSLATKDDTSSTSTTDTTAQSSGNGTTKDDSSSTSSTDTTAQSSGNGTAKDDSSSTSSTDTSSKNQDSHEQEPAADKIAMPDMGANSAREYHPDAQADEIHAVATANIALAFDLYTAYQQGNSGNFAYSVPDLAQALAMLAAGADGDTLSTLLGALHVDLQESRLHPAFNGSALDLSNRNSTAHLELNTALWGQGQSQNQAYYLFESGFLDTLEKNYGPGLEAVDFTAAAKAPIIANAIDPWLAAHSQNTLTGLVTSLTPRTRLVTGSSLSLDGAWQTPPDANPAAEGRFELSSNDQVLVPMLSFTGSFAYAEGNGYRAFELPLADSDLALWVLMPDHGRFAEFQSAFGPDQLHDILAAMTPTQKTLYLPKIAITSDLPSGAPASLALSGLLSEGQADFSRVNGEGYLFLGALSQRSAVSLSENAAQADGATITTHLANLDEPDSVWSGSGSSGNTTTWVDVCAPVPQYDPSLALARPFLFALRDRTTGSILSMGQVSNPGGTPAAPDSTTYPCGVPLSGG
ncbi:conserved repeat domain-containing protein [Methylomagnum ishizawai]|uniref:Conserved repeat domain-containing protein n=1 Tax=Methylomagnum ishizawai TaxID=1760988 RepID=A0A1Y6D2J7_9GAMM|nr:serpin family protein [Methylomagnum ishizawai]SMF96610.1 conserved repeat domain-containing protein [Methylomagnum ishizawai]